MRLDLNQHMRLEQRMKMAPRMIQSMEILQLPLMALEERIEQERLENPTLEMAEPGDSSGDETPEAETPAEEKSADDAAPDETPGEDEAPEEAPEAELDRLDELYDDWQEQYAEARRPSQNAIQDQLDRKQDAEQNIADKPPGLQEFLVEQLHYMDLEPDVRDMAEQLVCSLDENGYLKTDLVNVVDPNEGPAGLELAERALEVVQTLEPRGVGARDLAECLVLQIDPDDPLHDAMAAICRDHLVDVQQNRLPVIEKRTGLSMDEIKEAIEGIRHLNPRPGAGFETELVPTITPDLEVVEGEDGYELVPNERSTPPLRISRQYQELLRKRDLDPQTREFVQRKIQSAKWLIESIMQRRNTVERVARAIVEHQKAFLERGPSRIEPLKMQQIADRVGVHVTTVSRAVDGKYIQTPRGIFPLKRFFGGGTATSSGDMVAWDTVKQKLAELIEHEDKSKPYSDEQLAVQFEKQGLQIARRTITKYRKAMDIPSARRRKQY